MRNHKLGKRIGKIAAIFAVGIALTSCGTPKKVTYFQDVETAVIQEMTERQAIKVKPGDKLSIVVKSKNPELMELFNLPVMSTRLGQATNYNGSGSSLRSYTSSSEGMSTYTVNPKGNIDFPVLGELHIEGMTRSELSGYIKGELVGRDLAKDALVTVEFLNTGVSVLGEVNHPGRYDINSDELTILEAISLAGDLGIQGQRENVKVIRREADGMHTYQVDLTNLKSLAASPAYFLQQDDIIYVEPNGVKKRQTTVNGNTALSASFWVSVASLLTSVAVLIFK